MCKDDPSLTSTSWKSRGKRGVATLEFLFAAPAFFVLVFFVIELALIWNDRHLMRLAAYRSARAVIKTQAETKPAPTNLCWSSSPSMPAETPRQQLVQAAARRSAVKVMATVTPSVSQLMTSLGLGAGGQSFGKAVDLDIENNISSKLSVVANSIEKNPYAHAIIRMLKGLPAAWAFTEVECQNIRYTATQASADTPGVEIKLTYHRSAKMPYIGSLMYFLRKGYELSQQFGTSWNPSKSVLRVNPLSYGIEIDSSFGEETLIQARKQLKEMITDKARELGDQVQKRVDQTKLELNLPILYGNQQLPQVFSDIAGKSFEQVGDLLKGYQKTGELFDATAGVINQVSDQALNIFLMMPDEFKTIPVTVSVRMPAFQYGYLNQGEDWKGRAVMLADFANGDNHKKLAHQMGLTIDSGKPPTNGELPYAKKTPK
jgi:hypothetical protein